MIEAHQDISMIAARLPFDLDVARLRHDLDQLTHVPQVPQSGPYHDGDWTGIELYAQAGGHGDVPHPHLHPFAPTPALAKAPYLAEVLDRLECPKLLTRLLALPPDACIGEHSDSGSNFQYGALRLHVPIVTDPDVVMIIDGTRVDWPEGQLWWGDFSRPHQVRNDSEINRVHLVVDVEINQFVLDLFPAALVEAKRAEGVGISLHRPRVPSTDDELAPFACEFTMTPELMPLFGSGSSLHELAGEATAVCRPHAGRLVVDLDGEPAFALERTGATTFAVVGQPAGATFELAVGDDGARSAEIVLRGLPEDLYAARLGFQQGPVIREQRFSLTVLG